MGQLCWGDTGSRWRPPPFMMGPPLPGSVWKSLRETGEGVPSAGGVLPDSGEGAFCEREIGSSCSLARVSQSFRTAGVA